MFWRVIVVKIAYLAPEIPTLSATFVYNEIIALEKLGADIIPFSVHLPFSVVNDAELDTLKSKTYYLYEQAKLSILLNHFALIRQFPLRYFSTLKLLFKDMIALGGFSRNALGLAFRCFFAGNLAIALQRQKCQHIHVHFAHVPTDIAMYACAFIGASFSVTAHANDIFERGWLLPQKVQRSLFFATISNFNIRYLTKKGGDTNKLRIVRCGVDDTKFNVRQDFVSNQPTKIGVVGRLVEKKGIDSLICAVAELKRQGKLIELLIAGDGPLQENLMALQEFEGLSDTDVKFLGAMAHKDVPNFIKSVDIFVLPCKQDSQGDMDGIPVVLMEAMLSGVPVISTDISGIPELIVNTETGLLVPPNDTLTLSEAIAHLIQDIPLRDKIVAGAIAKVKQEFSLQGNAEKLYAMFGE